MTGSLANIVAVRLAGIDAESIHCYSLPYFVALLVASIPLVWLLGPG